MDEYISNPLETACTVLSSVGVSPEYSPSEMVTNLYLGDHKVGYVDFLTDPATGRKVCLAWVNCKRFPINTLEEIENLKEYIMCEYKVEDASAPKVIVQYRSDDTARIKENEKGDWYDLCADETVEMKAGEFRLIHLGVAMKLPAGYEGHLLPRSSTYKKWGIKMVNSMGIIDNSYCGPNDWWMFAAKADRDTKIERGERICQFRIVESQPRLRFVEGKMEEKDRGGFGSTGTK